jgi:hypothetical protein
MTTNRTAAGLAAFDAFARDLYNVCHPRTSRIDAFLVSFPKCGRTWLELMLAHGFVQLHGLDESLVSRDLIETRQCAGQGPFIQTTHERLIRFYKVWDFNGRLASHFKAVRYEDLRRDHGATLRSIFDFVGLTGVAPERIPAIYDACRFERMSALESAGRAGLLPASGPEASKARRGKIGGYVDELRPETIARLDDWMVDLPEYFSYSV